MGCCKNVGQLWLQRKSSSISSTLASNDLEELKIIEIIPFGGSMVDGVGCQSDCSTLHIYRSFSSTLCNCWDFFSNLSSSSSSCCGRLILKIHGSQYKKTTRTYLLQTKQWTCGQQIDPESCREKQKNREREGKEEEREE